mmetsp:Transcript_79302/g.139932  ORF Transcript_79302/g.139932 Transcript_79302/m.139932 type:complete len:160 (-) Transcript_79302:1090-1569(-)
MCSVSAKCTTPTLVSARYTTLRLHSTRPPTCTPTTMPETPLYITLYHILFAIWEPMPSFTPCPQLSSHTILPMSRKVPGSWSGDETGEGISKVSCCAAMSTDCIQTSPTMLELFNSSSVLAKESPPKRCCSCSEGSTFVTWHGSTAELAPAGSRYKCTL